MSKKVLKLPICFVLVVIMLFLFTSCSDSLENNKNVMMQPLDYKLNSDGVSYSVEGIGDFTGSNLVIPNMYKGKPVTKIGVNAFSNNSNLNEITIGENVSLICNYAFYNCQNVTKIKFNAKNCSSLGDGNYVFCNLGLNRTGVEVIIGKQVENVPESLFSYSWGEVNSKVVESKINKIIFEQGSVCTEIESNAFNGCSFESITFPESLKKIGTFAIGSDNLTKVVLNEGLEQIGQCAFYSCEDLKEITIPKTVKVIETLAFANNYKLETINYNAVNCEMGFEVFNYAGRDTKKISFYIGQDVVVIPSYIFSGYYDYETPKLTEITIPKNVKMICSEAFYNCNALVSVKFENKLNWYVVEDYISNDKNQAIKIDVNNENKNVELLTSTYAYYTWFIA